MRFNKHVAGNYIKTNHFRNFIVGNYLPTSYKICAHHTKYSAMHNNSMKSTKEISEAMRKDKRNRIKNK